MEEIIDHTINHIHNGISTRLIKYMPLLKMFKTYDNVEAEILDSYEQIFNQNYKIPLENLKKKIKEKKIT